MREASKQPSDNPLAAHRAIALSPPTERRAHSRPVSHIDDTLGEAYKASGTSSLLPFTKRTAKRTDVPPSSNPRYHPLEKGRAKQLSCARVANGASEQRAISSPPTFWSLCSEAEGTSHCIHRSLPSLTIHCHKFCDFMIWLGLVALQEFTIPIHNGVRLLNPPKSSIPKSTEEFDT